jgi:hypothetical protein
MSFTCGLREGIWLGNWKWIVENFGVTVSKSNIILSEDA